jgi:fructose-specific phosphotransferase system component IIB
MADNNNINNNNNNDNDDDGNQQPASLGEIKRALDRIEAACQDANQHLHIEENGQDGEENPQLLQAKAAIAAATHSYGQLNLGVVAEEDQDLAHAMLASTMSAEEVEEADAVTPELVRFIQQATWAEGKDTESQMAELICATMRACVFDWRACLIGVGI